MEPRRESSIGRETKRTHDGPHLILAIGILIGALLLSIPTMRNLLVEWREHQFYSHVLIMSLMATWLVYSNRGAIAKALSVSEPPAYGFLVVLTAAGFEVLSYIGDVRSAAGVGLPVLFGAIAYAIAGLPLVRLLVGPLCCLALMVPPGFIINPLLVQLKLLVSHVSLEILQATGDTVTGQGLHIVMPGHRLVIANHSSGLSSMLSTLPVALLVAYSCPYSAWLRPIIVAAAVPVVIGMNVIRVVLAAKLVPVLGQEQAQSFLRSDLGIPIVAVATLCVVTLAAMLSRLSSNSWSGDT